MACQDAVRSGGYYYGGSWYPMMYRYPYPYYYDSYRTYVSNGGRVVAVPAGSYARPAGARGRGTWRIRIDGRGTCRDRERGNNAQDRGDTQAGLAEEGRGGGAHLAYRRAALLERIGLL